MVSPAHERKVSRRHFAGRLVVVGELDGVWNVKRVGGTLPPMVGVRKEISGGTGTTKLGRLPGAPFDVVGLSLRYRRPFGGFVDELEPGGDGYRGRATFRGREFGNFELERIENEGEAMASENLKQQLVRHIDEAYAMEQNVLRMLDGMIQTTDDQAIRDELREHKLQTERHAERMKQRLEAHDASPSMVKEIGGMAGALMKSVLDMTRSEKAGRNARDGYATEHLEIAAYQLLERIATQAGDEETAEAARENRKDEEAMAKKLDGNWDRFAELVLEEQGVKASAS
jgi:ferritin-like metal-binding protein YciE